MESEHLAATSTPIPPPPPGVPPPPGGPPSLTDVTPAPKSPVTGESMLEDAEISEEQREILGDMAELTGKLKESALYRKMQEKTATPVREDEDVEEIPEPDSEEFRQAKELLSRLDAILESSGNFTTESESRRHGAQKFVDEVVSVRNRIDEILGIPTKTSSSMGDILRGIHAGVNLRSAEDRELGEKPEELTPKELLMRELMEKIALRNQAKIAQPEQPDSSEVEDEVKPEPELEESEKLLI